MPSSAYTRSVAPWAVLLTLLACSTPDVAMQSDEHPMSNSQELTQRIESLLQAADQAIQRTELKAANDLLKQALEELGDRYARPDTIDESGMRLVLAAAEEKKGELSKAANLRRGVLTRRLAALREKIGTSQPSQPGR